MDRKQEWSKKAEISSDGRHMFPMFIKSRGFGSLQGPGELPKVALCAFPSDRAPARPIKPNVFDETEGNSRRTLMNRG